MNALFYLTWSSTLSTNLSGPSFGSTSTVHNNGSIDGGSIGGAIVKIPPGNRGSHGLHLYTSSLLSLFGVFTVVRLRGKGAAISFRLQYFRFRMFVQFS